MTKAPESATSSYGPPAVEDMVTLGRRIQLTPAARALLDPRPRRQRSSPACARSTWMRTPSPSLPACYRYGWRSGGVCSARGMRFRGACLRRRIRRWGQRCAGRFNPRTSWGRPARQRRTLPPWRRQRDAARRPRPWPGRKKPPTAHSFPSIPSWPPSWPALPSPWRWHAATRSNSVGL